MDVEAEPYCPSRKYDLVWFLNVTEEIMHLRKHTDTRLFVVGMEPEYRYPPNYNTRLLDQAHYYMGYRDFSSQAGDAEFEPFYFPTYTRNEIREHFKNGIQTKKIYDFCLFARHDPNIRLEIAAKIRNRNSILVGPLFDREVTEKFPIQIQCRYEFITENDLNKYYVSEKLGQALIAGCVPIYFGASCAKEIYPPELFIDMRDFLDDDGIPKLDELVEYCSSDDVYLSYKSNIERGAQEVLLNRFSIESCLIEPVQKYIWQLTSEGWRSTQRTNYDALRRLKHAIKPFVGS